MKTMALLVSLLVTGCGISSEPNATLLAELEASSRSIVEQWLEDQKTGGTGERFWAKWFRDNGRCERLYAVRDYEILKTSSYDVYVRVDSSNKLGHPITKHWRISVNDDGIDKLVDLAEPDWKEELRQAVSSNDSDWTERIINAQRQRSH